MVRELMRSGSIDPEKSVNEKESWSAAQEKMPLHAHCHRRVVERKTKT